jgi:hypothetical protein
MFHDTNLIDSNNLTNWQTVYHPYELMLYDKTFSLSNLEHSKIWHTNFYFSPGGSFGNMSSNQESSWRIGHGMINIYNKENELTRVIDTKSLVNQKMQSDLELQAKIVDTENYLLFTQDGIRELAGKNFSEQGELLLYDGNPSQHIDYNLMCPPIYLGHERPATLLLQFDIKVDDVFEFMMDDTFFAIVGHEKSVFNFQDDTLDIQKLSMNFENLTSKKWKTIAMEIKLSSNYISVGPYLTQKGHVVFKNIGLTRLAEDDLEYVVD